MYFVEGAARGTTASPKTLRRPDTKLTNRSLCVINTLASCRRQKITFCVCSLDPFMHMCSLDLGRALRESA